jgi:hypothetical protein
MTIAKTELANGLEIKQSLKMCIRMVKQYY